MAKSCISFLDTLLSSFSTNLDVFSRAYSTAQPISNELTPIQPPMGSFDKVTFKLGVCDLELGDNLGLAKCH